MNWQQLFPGLAGSLGLRPEAAPTPDQTQSDKLSVDYRGFPRSAYRIESTSSDVNEFRGFSLVCGLRVVASHPSALFLGALVDALMRGVDEYEAFLIAEAMYRRPDPTLAERTACHPETDPWRPAENPYKLDKLST